MALVPWFIQLAACSKKAAFWSGYFLGAIIVLDQMFMILGLVDKWTGNLGLALVPWILCGFLGAFYFAFVGLLVRSALMRNYLWAIPMIWAGVEVGRSFIPGLAFPWFLISTSMTAYPALDQLAFFGTQYMIGAWVCLVNVLVAGAALGRKPASAYWVVATAFPILSLCWYLRPVHTTPLRIAMGQPGFDMAFGDQHERDRELAIRINRISELALQAHASLLVLPEGVVSESGVPPEPSFELFRSLPVLFGGQRGRGPVYQTAFLFDGRNWSYADKSRLVVFGEYVPGRDYLPFLKNFNVPGGDLTPAANVESVRLPNLVIGPMLCFEGLFYDVAHKHAENGAQILAQMSIDDWYMGTSGPDELKDSATWRTIETGLPIVRSASLGYTLAVDQKGRTLGQLPLHTSDVLVVDVPIEKSPLRNPLRPLFPWASGIFPFAFAGYCWLGVLRRKRRGSEC